MTTGGGVVFNEGGQPYANHRTLAVQGFLAGTGQADLTQKENALRAAMRFQFQDIVLYNDDGTPSPTSLYNLGSITGVTFKGPDFPTATGPEYATIRSFSFYAEAEYPLLGSTVLLLNYTESMSFSGGGPLYIHRLAINGLPQKQLVYPATVFKVTQAGQASGYLSYPSPAAPRWPQALKEAPHIRRVSPKRRARGYQDFAVAWQYDFESATPLVGLPTVWIN